jgi:predicted ThiF/HesA family dinucleotide-utilizing enzyme
VEGQRAEGEHSLPFVAYCKIYVINESRYNFRLVVYVVVTRIAGSDTIPALVCVSVPITQHAMLVISTTGVVLRSVQ